MHYISTELGYDIHWDFSCDRLIIIDTETKETFYRVPFSQVPVNGIIFHYTPQKNVLRIYEQTYIVDCREEEAPVVQMQQKKSLPEIPEFDF
jgi:hypothetical protein